MTIQPTGCPCRPKVGVVATVKTPNVGTTGAALDHGFTRGILVTHNIVLIVAMGRAGRVRRAGEYSAQGVHELVCLFVVPTGVPDSGVVWTNVVIVGLPWLWVS